MRTRGAVTLSPRETEVLRLVALGWTNAQIAEELVIEGGTVRTHLQNIHRCIGEHSRVRTARWAWEHGIASVEEVGPR